MSPFRFSVFHLLLCWMSSACLNTAHVPIQSPPQQAHLQPVQEPTKVLSAHLQTMLSNPHERKVTYTLVAVFSHELDPMSLDAKRFLIVLQNGQQLTPHTAIFGPAQESDENRTINLQITVPLEAQASHPAQLIVMGPLYSETGQIFRDLSIPIRLPSTASEMLFAERIPTQENRCPQSVQMLRSYWTLPMVASETFSLQQIRVFLLDGSRIHPSALDDHEQDSHGAHNRDNVIDFCLQSSSPAILMEIDRGALIDIHGFRNPFLSTEIMSARLSSHE